MARCFWTAVTLSVTLFATTSAQADVVDAARTSYDQGKRAYDLGAYEDAARAFARADAITPNASVLELALTAAMRADAPALGMELVDRARRRGLSELAHSGAEAFSSKVGRVVVACPTSLPCEAKLDDEPLAAGTVRWVRTGDHDAEIRADGVDERMVLHVESDRINELRPTHVLRVRVPVLAPLGTVPPAPERPVAHAGGLHPGWFFGALAVTAVSGTAATLSGLDTLALHREFEDDPSRGDLAERGESAQTRTNVLVITTSVFAVATGVIGYLVLRTRHD